MGGSLAARLRGDQALRVALLTQACRTLIVYQHPPFVGVFMNARSHRWATAWAAWQR